MSCKFKIKGLDCANCAAELERAIQKVDGVESVSISFMTERMEIDYGANNKDEIMKKIRKVVKREEPDVELEEM